MKSKTRELSKNQSTNRPCDQEKGQTQKKFIIMEEQNANNSAKLIETQVSTKIINIVL